MRRLLALETSCDDTCVSICEIRDGVFFPATNFVHSQDHNKYRGILPEYAARSHCENLPYIVEHMLREQNITPSDIDYVAVTHTPGLIGSLMVGTSYAKGFAWAAKKPIVGVHHIEAHILIAHHDCELDFPYGALVMSGGHTILVIVKGFGDYVLLGQSLDDAAGECFDKVARAMDLPQPGGPNIENLAKSGQDIVPLPIPLHRDGGCNFSFSGLKTATIRSVESGKFANAHIAHSFQATVAKTLVERVGNARLLYPDVLDWALVGGVAANQYLKSALVTHMPDVKFHAPAMKLCTDNAVMIGYAAKFYIERGIFANLDLEPIDYVRIDQIHKR